MHHAPRGAGDKIDVSGKVAIVTGASRGIGAASAKVLAAAGIKVVLAARWVPAPRTAPASRTRRSGWPLRSPACCSARSRLRRVWSGGAGKFPLNSGVLSRKLSRN